MQLPVVHSASALLTKFWKWLKAGLLAYLIVVMALTLLQRRLMYHPSRATFLDVARSQRVVELFPDAENVSVKCDDGITIRGWHLQHRLDPKNEAAERRPLVIYFHGNAGDRSMRGPWYELFHNLGWNVLAYDYHGYGDSDGKISETALQLDCVAIWKSALEDLHYKPQQIMVVGTSLGGAAAIYTAARACEEDQPPAGLVTVATFSSMVDAASFHYPWIPVRLVLADRFPSIERIQKVTCPMLMMHGDADRVVPQSLGRRLFDAAPKQSAAGIPRRWVDLPGFGHNGLPVYAADLLLPELQRFGQQVLPDAEAKFPESPED